MTRISLRQAWLALIGGVLIAALVPAGVALDRQLARELEQEARADLAMAPKLLADRNATGADALMMHAKEVAGTPGVAQAVAAGRREEALRRVRRGVPGAGEEAVVVGPDGEPWTESGDVAEAVEATRAGRMPVRFSVDGDTLYRVSVAPLEADGSWVGAAGVRTRVGEGTAATLAGLTRSDVAIVSRRGAVVASTRSAGSPRVLSDSASAWAEDGGVHELATEDGARYWAAAAPLGEAGVAVFIRSVSEELGLLPGLRRSALIAGLVALAVALLLGGALAARMARPVRGLARASGRLADGDFGAPLPSTRIREVDQVREAFGSMRQSLAEKIRELTAANEELAERQERLQALQSELIQRDRMAATGRLVTELAHEIRNPVASVRNCLEIIDSRLPAESELREFSSMAIEELLRMHRLSEQMLDANRPLDPDAERCRPVEVAERVAQLTRTAGKEENLSVRVDGPRQLEVRMGPDALKQVLLNLVENAREAVSESPSREGGTVEIVVKGDGDVREPGRATVEVRDDGPGIPEEIRSRLFDPFVTTKDEVHGVGLGLFVAQGLVRRHGGSLRAADREEGGARFVLELPVADGDAASGERGGSA